MRKCPLCGAPPSSHLASQCDGNGTHIAVAFVEERTQQLAAAKPAEEEVPQANHRENGGTMLF